MYSNARHATDHAAAFEDGLSHAGRELSRSTASLVPITSATTAKLQHGELKTHRSTSTACVLLLLLHWIFACWLQGATGNLGTCMHRVKQAVKLQQQS